MWIRPLWIALTLTTCFSLPCHCSFKLALLTKPNADRRTQSNKMQRLYNSNRPTNPLLTDREIWAATVNVIKDLSIGLSVCFIPSAETRSAVQKRVRPENSLPALILQRSSNHLRKSQTSPCSTKGEKEKKKTQLGKSLNFLIGQNKSRSFGLEPFRYCIHVASSQFTSPNLTLSVREIAPLPLIDGCAAHSYLGTDNRNSIWLKSAYFLLPKGHRIVSDDVHHRHPPSLYANEKLSADHTC